MNHHAENRVPDPDPSLKLLQKSMARVKMVHSRKLITAKSIAYCYWQASVHFLKEWTGTTVWRLPGGGR